MAYLLAFFSFITTTCNTFCNKLGAGKNNCFVTSLIKSIFLFIGANIMVLAFGKFDSLFAINPTQWVFLLLSVATYIIHTVLYFLAIKQSNLHAFAPFMEPTILFTSNILYFIFMFSDVTGNGNPASIALYSLGLAMLAFAPMLIVFSKTLNKNCSRKWMIVAAISAMSLGLTNFFVKFGASGLHTSVLCWWQMGGLLVVMIALVFPLKLIPEIKKVNRKNLFFIFLSAIFAFASTYLRNYAYTFPDANPALINLIYSCAFVLVFIINCVSHHESIPKILWVVAFLVIGGMAVQMLSAIF